VFSWRGADSYGCRCFLVFCSLATELAKLPKFVGVSSEKNETDLQLRGCNKGVAEGPPTLIKSAAKGAPKMSWHSYQTGKDHPEANGSHLAPGFNKALHLIYFGNYKSKHP
jgi:hypothetical protein